MFLPILADSHAEYIYARHICRDEESKHNLYGLETPFEVSQPRNGPISQRFFPPVKEVPTPIKR